MTAAVKVGKMSAIGINSISPAKAYIPMYGYKTTIPIMSTASPKIGIKPTIK